MLLPVELFIVESPSVNLSNVGQFVGLLRDGAYLDGSSGKFEAVHLFQSFLRVLGLVVSYETVTFRSIRFLRKKIKNNSVLWGAMV